MFLQIYNTGRSGAGMPRDSDMPEELAIVFILFLIVVSVVIYLQGKKEKKIRSGLSRRASERKALKEIRRSKRGKE